MSCFKREIIKNIENMIAQAEWHPLPDFIKLIGAAKMDGYPASILPYSLTEYCGFAYSLTRGRYDALLAALKKHLSISTLIGEDPLFALNEKTWTAFSLFELAGNNPNEEMKRCVCTEIVDYYHEETKQYAGAKLHELFMLFVLKGHVPSFEQLNALCADDEKKWLEMQAMAKDLLDDETEFRTELLLEIIYPRLAVRKGFEEGMFVFFRMDENDDPIYLADLKNFSQALKCINDFLKAPSKSGLVRVLGELYGRRERFKLGFHYTLLVEKERNALNGEALH